MKKIVIFISLLVMLAAGAFWFLTGSALNDLIKQQIEQVGAKVIEQPVTVKQVDMKLLEGAGTIKGLVLANPKKYSAPSVFSLDEVTLDINLESLTTDLIIIEEVVIDKPNTGIMIDKLIWHEMHDFSEDCILMVIASDLYDESDYLRNYNDFSNFVGNS